MTLLDPRKISAEGLADGTYALTVAGGAVTGMTLASGSGGGLTAEDVRDIIGTTLVAGANVTITPDDAADTVTVAAAGGSGGGSGAYLSLNVAKMGVNPTVTVPLGGAVPNNLFNGNTDTNDYVNVGTGVREVQVDFGQTLAFRLLRWWMFYGDARVFTNVALYASADGTTWTTLRAPANWQPNTTSGFLEFALTGTPYRYFKMHSEGNAQYNSNEYVEFEAYVDVLLR